jgi:hypothetical protein
MNLFYLEWNVVDSNRELLVSLFLLLEPLNCRFDMLRQGDQSLSLKLHLLFYFFLCLFNFFGLFQFFFLFIVSQFKEVLFDIIEFFFTVLISVGFLILLVILLFIAGARYVLEAVVVPAKLIVSFLIKVVAIVVIEVSIGENVEAVFVIVAALLSLNLFFRVLNTLVSLVLHTFLAALVRSDTFCFWGCLSFIFSTFHYS